MKPNYEQKESPDGNYWEVVRKSDNKTVGFVLKGDVYGYADLVKAFEVFDRMQDIQKLI